MPGSCVDDTAGNQSEALHSTGISDPTLQDVEALPDASPRSSTPADDASRHSTRLAKLPAAPGLDFSKSKNPKGDDPNSSSSSKIPRLPTPRNPALHKGTDVQLRAEIDALHGDFQATVDRFASVDERFDYVEQEIGTLTTTVNSLSTDVNLMIDKLNNVLDKEPEKAPCPAPTVVVREPPEQPRLELTKETVEAMLTRVEGGHFVGNDDPRSFAEFSQLVRQHNMYLYGDAVTRYFFLLHNLSPSVHNSTVFGLQYGEAQDTPLCTSVSDFQELLDKVWNHLMDEFAKSSGLFDHYKALRLLRLSPGADFDAHLSRFTTLVRAIQREKGSIDDRETAAHWYNSLDEQGLDDIDRAPAQDVKSFAQMRERSRGFYRSLKKTWKANHAGKPVTTNAATTTSTPTTTSPAATVQAHHAATQPPSSSARPKTSSFWDTTAQRPADGVADSDGSGLPMIKLSLSTPSSDLTQSDNCIGTEALLDSGAEQPLCAEDEFNRWCNAGLNLPLWPDSRIIIFGSPANQSAARGRACVTLHLDDQTSVEVDVLVVKSLNCQHLTCRQRAPRRKRIQQRPSSLVKRDSRLKRPDDQK
ncbi:Casein kinase I isoform delta [Perkinsus olseni]|uniref:Casein kinase I isoform delta n=1 Tax=Perkinsus olseni TaxID=32597 RepID=A0A7J6MZE2_PEROL|nr:Casein kinase I isoform delta [Perkinsus olseni]